MWRKKTPLFFKCSLVFLFWFFFEAGWSFSWGRTADHPSHLHFLDRERKLQEFITEPCKPCKLQTGIFVDQEPRAFKGWFECVPWPRMQPQEKSSSLTACCALYNAQVIHNKCGLHFFVSCCYVASGKNHYIITNNNLVSNQLACYFSSWNKSNFGEK